jgi:hypothetical protein
MLRTEPHREIDIASLLPFDLAQPLSGIGVREVRREGRSSR